MSAQNVIENSNLKMIHKRPVTLDQVLGTLELVTAGVGLDLYGVQTPTEHLSQCLAELKCQAARSFVVTAPKPAPAIQPARPATPLEKPEVMFVSSLETLQKQVTGFWRKPELAQG